MIAKHAKTVATLLALGLCVSDAAGADASDVPGAAGAPVAAGAAAGAPAALPPTKFDHDANPDIGLSDLVQAMSAGVNVDWARSTCKIKYHNRRMEYDQEWIDYLLRKHPSRKHKKVKDTLGLARKKLTDSYKKYVYKPAKKEWKEKHEEEGVYKFYDILAEHHLRDWRNFEKGQATQIPHKFDIGNEDTYIREIRTLLQDIIRESKDQRTIRSYHETFGSEPAERKPNDDADATETAESAGISFKDRCAIMYSAMGNKAKAIWTRIMGPPTNDGL